MFIQRTQKTNPPIAPASNPLTAPASQAPNITLYFLDSSSRLRQIQTSDPTSAWTLGPTDGDYNVPSSASHLASYSCQHPSYPDYRDAWFQADSGYYQIVDGGSSGSKTQVDAQVSASDITMVKPPTNASLAIVPHYMYDYNITTRSSRRPYVSLFFINSDILYEYHYYDSEFDFLRKHHQKRR